MTDVRAEAGTAARPAEATQLTCYLCGCERGVDVFVDQGIPIRRCSGCGHVYSSWRQAEHYDGYWDAGVSDHDVDFWDGAHRPVFEQFVDAHLRADRGRLVDVGCGLGYFVATVRRRRPGWQVDGYELAPGAVRFAHEQNGLERHVHLGRVEEAGIAPGSVDVVTLWDVIEHLPRPQPLLEHLRTLLAPGGYVFLQTPSWPFQVARARVRRALAGRGPDLRNHLYARDHVQQFSRASLAHLATSCGFAEPTYEVLKPVMAVDGSRSAQAVAAKRALYHATRATFRATGGRVLLNPTLFATLRPA